MSKFEKTIPCPGYNARQLFEVILKKTGELEEKFRGLGRLTIQNEPENMTLSADSSYGKFKIFCEADQVRVLVELGWLALPFKQKIETGLVEWSGRWFPKKNE